MSILRPAGANHERQSPAPVRDRPHVRGSTWNPSEMAEDGKLRPSGDAGRRPTPQRGVVTGVVRALQERGDERGRVMSFRVEQHDPEGRAVQVVPVEIRGLSLHGFLTEGDWVEIRRRWKPGKTLRPRVIRNLSTGGEFRSKGRLGLRKALALVAFLIVATIMVVVFLNLTGIYRNFSPRVTTSTPVRIR